MLQLIVSGGIALTLPACTRPQREAEGNTLPASPQGRAAQKPSLAAIGPIDRTRPNIAPREFSGDPTPTAIHEALWNRDAFLQQRGGLPKATERAPVVIVGGGMSGLIAAYHLKDQPLVLLEQGPRLGGNSRGESWHGVDYSIGAAYMAEPTEDTWWADFLREVGVTSRWRESGEVGTIGLAGKIVPGFWDGKTVPPAQAPAVTRLRDHFLSVLNGTGGLQYPEIPSPDAESRQWVNTLDGKSFTEHVRSVLGAEPTGQLRALLEYYCWSTLAGSTSELSAATALNNFAAEFGKLVVLPGGNSALAEAIVKRLISTLPPTALRPQSLAIDVRRTQEGVQVTYGDAQGNLRGILAQAVILACPKFVVKNILWGIEPKRAQAIAQMSYRSYLVANVLLRGQPKQSHLHDLYMLGAGNNTFEDPRAAVERAGFTDLILANYTQPHPERTVLTLYQGLPYDGTRPMMLTPNFYNSVHNAAQRQLEQEILPMLGFSPDQMVDLRLTRWGHPIPLARAGLISGGLPETLTAPFAERVFFAEQDNWVSPWVEAAAAEARRAALAVRKVLHI